MLKKYSPRQILGTALMASGASISIMLLVILLFGFKHYDLSAPWKILGCVIFYGASFWLLLPEQVDIDE